MFTRAWEARTIPELPRCLAAVAAMPKGSAEAKPLTKAQVAKLWQRADPQLRACMAVDLNCGLYSVNIAKLTDSDLTKTHLATRRSKTGAPGRWKLWPVTRQLIEATRQDGPEQPLLWRTDRGKPLHHHSGKTASDYLSRRLRKVAGALGVNASWSHFRDTGAAFIEAWGREQSDAMVTSAYLAHSDGRMARHYLKQDPREVNTGRLDEATDAMCKHLGLSSSTRQTSSTH